jgi:hypothetical protein
MHAKEQVSTFSPSFVGAQLVNHALPDAGTPQSRSSFNYDAVVQPHSALFIAVSLWITGKLELKAVVAQVADKVEHR